MANNQTTTPREICVMENPPKIRLKIQVSKEDVNSPDFNLLDYLNKKIEMEWFKKAQESEQT